MSAFGKGRPRKPQPTVDTVARIDVRDIARVLFTPRAREEVRVLINGKPEALDVVFDDRNYGGRGQPYFRCATCSRRVQHLYLRGGDSDLRGDGDLLACRRCARGAGGLTYASQHTRRRGLNRVRRLREKIGALPSPLSPIPQRPRYVRRDYWMKAVAELGRAEAVIAGELRAMVPGVRRRLRYERSNRDARRT